MRNSLRYRLAGTAFVCFSLLVYEIFSARLLSVVVGGPLAIFAIAFAMLGMGAATSIMSVTRWPRTDGDSDRLLSQLAAILGLAYPLCLLLVTAVSEQTNTVLESAMTAGGFNGLIDSIRDNRLATMMWVGSILFVPYFLFGIFIAALFKTCRQAEYHLLYAADLIGASLGCIAFVVVLDVFGYSGGLVAIIAPAFLGAAAFARLLAARAVVVPLLLAGASCLAVLSPTVVSLFEPQPAFSQLARNYDGQYDVEQTWYVWNAHSRVAQLRLADRDSDISRWVYAHETGEGWAYVPLRPEDGAQTPESATGLPRNMGSWNRLAAAFEPKRVLVLFAGVGRDMADLYEDCGGNCEIVGVEINRHMVEHALSGVAPAVTELLAKPGVRLEVAEAREFLGRDRSRYDAILLSWWGAGTSHYLGSTGQLAQYLYTAEAFEALLEHLTPDGILVMYNGNKAQTLVNIREVYRSQGWGTLDGKVAMFGPVAHKPEDANYMETVDSKRLVFKPSGFRQDELQRLRQLAAAINLRMIFSPDGVEPGYRIYQEIVDGRTIDDINADLERKYNAALSIVTDNRPFLGYFLPGSFYTDIANWVRADVEMPQWKFTQFYMIFILFVAIAAFTIIIAPLLMRSGPAINLRNVMNLFYFMSLGAGFILIEVAFLRKFGLILGHPSYAIAIVLAAVIFSTGVGSLLTGRFFALPGVTENRVALAIVLYAVLGNALYGQFVGTIVGLPIWVKALFVIVALFPLGFLLGQLFPQGLKRIAPDDERLVPWAWAINATASTVGVGLADLIARPLGFDWVLYLGAAFYIIVALLPLRARAVKLATA